MLMRDIECIVYTSKAGHTRRCAEMIGEEAGIPIRELSESSDLGHAPVMFMGGISAGKPKELSKALKTFDVRAVCMASGTVRDDYVDLLVKKNKPLSGIPVFPLRGGFELDKVHGMDRFMMQIMRRFLARAVPPEGERTEEDEKRVRMYTVGLYCVSRENLSGVVEWLRS